MMAKDFGPSIDSTTVCTSTASSPSKPHHQQQASSSSSYSPLFKQKSSSTETTNIFNMKTTSKSGRPQKHLSEGSRLWSISTASSSFKLH